MTDKRVRLEAAAMAEYQSAVTHWIDLPDYVGTTEYRDALMTWVGKKIDAGNDDMSYLIVMTLHHETGGRQPYFNFPREANDEGS